MEYKSAKEIGYIKLSQHRKKVFLFIKNELKLPSEISKATELGINDVSRALKGLKDKKLVRCLNEEEKRGRVYTLTEKGLEILKYIE
jgi:predicted transcriptional regulator